MPYEDFTSYTVVEPDDRIQVATFQIDAVLFRNEDAYVYDSKGIGHFRNFDHDVTVKLSAADNSSYGPVWALTNVVDDLQALQTGNNEFLAVFFYRTAGGVYLIYLREFDGAAETQDSLAINVNTTYYLTIKRDGTDITCDVYSDSARTVLVGTCAVANAMETTLRYVFGVNTFNDGNAPDATVVVTNLDLHPAHSYGYVMM